jgi:hypothetical protein
MDVITGQIFRKNIIYDKYVSGINVYGVVKNFIILDMLQYISDML